MKYILTLLVVSMFVNAKAQTYLPDSIAKKVIIELIQKDSLTNEVKYLNNILILTNNKVIIKDQIINLYESKEINYKQEIDNLEKINKKLDNKQKWLKVKGRILGTSTSALLGILAVFLIIK